MRNVALSLASGFARWVCRTEHRFRTRKHILFVCDSALAAEYMAEFWGLFGGDQRLRAWTLLPPRMDPACAEAQAIQRALRLPCTSARAARLRQWDLVCSTYHTEHEDIVDRRRQPTLLVPHGIESGKKVKGVVSTFGPLAWDSSGHVRYTRVFDASALNRGLAIQLNPEYRDIVAVVGNLRDDAMLRMCERREQIRAGMGIKAGEKVVFVLSTWGPACLWQTVGDAVLAQSRKLLDEFRFILNAHPHEYRPKPPGERVWGEVVRAQRQHAYLVREPDADWAPYMVACDVLLTDHTSLALHGALLGRPAVYVPVSDELLEPGSLVWQYRHLSPVVRLDCSDLRERLTEALASYPLEPLQRLSREINSCPGQASDLVRHEVYQLLGLAQPLS